MSIDVLTIDFNDSGAPAKFVDSFKSSGFAIIKNHPINSSLIENVYSNWRTFFNSNDKHKYIFDPQSQDGYFPYLTENAKNSNIKDLKEFYHIYPWGKFPHTISDSTMKLYGQIVDFSGTLLNWLDENSPNHIKDNFSIPLESMIKDSTSNLFRIIHYPPITDTADKNALRAAPHEDINLITILMTGSEPGLEVMDLDGSWHEVSCDKNTLIVNSGDMLKMASNNYYPSTTHRVVNPDKSQNVSRFSMPLFIHPRDNVKLNEQHSARTFLNKRLKEIGLKD